MDRVPGGPPPGGMAPGAAGRLRPIVFTGSGGEYFRIWIVNLLLSILSLGIYSAWAKVRRQRYFHRNTRLAGSAFDYHARPRTILIGRIVAIAVLAAFIVATELEPLAALALLAAWLLALPWIVHRALRFRHANTSWRGIRFGFLGTVRQAYRALMLPVIVWMLVLGLGFAGALWHESDALLVLLFPVAGLGSYALLPLLHYRLKRYHHDNACLGTLPARFSARARMFYGVYLRSAVLAVVVVIGFFLLLATAILAIGGIGNAIETAANAARSPAAGAGLGLLGAAAFWLAWAVVRPYFQARMQNLAWNRTRIGPHRFVSRVKVRRLWAIRMSNLVLVMATLGLFLPFAAVRLARYRLESVEVAALGDLDRIVGAERERIAAIGEEAADLFDLDIGI
ncbi:MAG: YjgN family protein [Burkholderiaceae bacterium]|nr:YjgN family protein [Burkholderiaceae bacterium]MEB2320814.1 YjgN family protein [Pseudomonadota bacterium]